MESLTSLPSTELSTRLSIEAPRELSRSQLAQVTKFINRARKLIQPWDEEAVKDRVLELTGKKFLEEINYVAQNCLAVEQIPESVGLFPSTVFDPANPSMVSFASINSRDWLTTADVLVSKLQEIVTAELREPDRFAPLGELAGMGIAAIVNGIHHFPSAVGRLSRIYSAIYWPEVKQFRSEQVARLYVGSISTANGLKSFTDPGLSLSDNALIHAFGFENLLVEYEGQTAVNIPILETWSQFFGSDPELADTLDFNCEALFKNAPLIAAELMNRHYRTQNPFGRLKTKGLTKLEDSGFSEEELQKLFEISDAYEVALARYIPLMGFQAARVAYQTILSEGQDLTLREKIGLIAESSRRARIEVVREELGMLGNPERQAVLIPGTPIAREVMKDQFEAGIHYVKTGLFPDIEIAPNIPASWMPRRDREVGPPSIDSINQGLGHFFGRD